MTAALTIDIVLGTVVLMTVVGMLAWSIPTQNGVAATRIARRRRRMRARARLLGRTGTVGNRA